MALAKKCAMALVTAALAFSAGAVPAARSAPKATGEVYFDNAGLMAFSKFNAHEAFAGRPAKGNFYYADSGAMGMRWYSIDVTCVDVEGDGATFSGPIYATNVPEWEGLWVQIWVYDGGTPGWNGDEITGQFFQGPDCLPFTEPPPWIDVAAGNLVVHD